MRTSIVFCLSASLMMLAACDSAEAVDSEEDAVKGWAATQSALETGSAGTYQTAVDIDTSADCLNGGTAHFKGTVDTTIDLENPAAGNSTNLDYTTTFNGCTTQGVTIDGTLDYTLMTMTSGEGSASVHYTYAGEVTWSGDVSGSCVIDMSADVVTDTTGASVSYKGSVCGFDAAATLNVNL